MVPIHFNSISSYHAYSSVATLRRPISQVCFASNTPPSNLEPFDSAANNLDELITDYLPAGPVFERAQKLLAELRRIHAAEAYTDELTEIHNRRFFDMQLPIAFQNAQAQQTDFAIIALDIDCFKDINDRYGHPVGDTALHAVAKVLNHSIRTDRGDFLCRYGGEEFAIVLPKTNYAGAQVVAERILKAVPQITQAIRQRALANTSGTMHQPQKTDLATLAQSRDLSISVGVAHVKLLSNEITDPHLLYNLADQASYKAKLNGKNQAYGVSVSQDNKSHFLFNGPNITIPSTLQDKFKPVPLSVVA